MAFCIWRGDGVRRSHAPVTPAGFRMRAIRRLLREQRGATAMEYALIAALISIAIFVGAGVLGLRLDAFYQWLAESVTAAIS